MNRSAGVIPVLVLAAATSISACGSSDGGAEQVAYCVDDQGVVIDDRYCDPGYAGPAYSHPFYIWYGYYPYGLAPGTNITVYNTNGTPTRIDPKDSTARSNAGLPSTGKITNGSTKSGGFGKPATGGGSSGGAKPASGSSGGFGGGGGKVSGGSGARGGGSAGG